MSNIKRITALALIAAYAMSTTVSALEISLSRDVEKNIVTGTVTTDSAKEHEPVLIKTVNENGDAVYLNQIYTDSNGKAKFEYIHETEKAGAGVMTVTAKTASETDQDTYNQASKSEIDTILQTIKTECAKENPDVTVIRDVYTANAQKLELDLTKYNTLADGNGAEEVVFSHIANDTENKTKISTVSDVLKAFYAGVAVAVINKTGQADDVLALMKDDKYVHTFNLDSIPKDEQGTSILDGFTDDVRTKVFERLASSDSESAADLSQKLVMYTLTEGLRHGDFNSVNKILTAYNNAGLISISTTVYDGLKNKTAVDKLMTGVEYADYKAVETRFASMVDTQYKAENSTQKPNSSSGGGGGGGGYSKNDFTFETVPSTGEEESTSSQSNSSALSGKMIFSDMEQAKWAIEAVEALYNKGIINGINENSFEPNRGISRAEFVKILVCLTQTPLDTNENVFTDVTSENWYYPYACAAFKAGIVEGDDRGRFDGGKIINREEMAVMLFRVIEKMEMTPAQSDVLGFDDDELISDWAKESVNYLKRTGIVNGRSKNFYEPKAELTRAEAAAVVYKLLNLA